MTKILLVDADSRKDFPNLVLMKISAWHKEQGDRVELITGIPSALPLYSYDRIYISCIFTENKEKVLNYASQLPKDNVVLGGSGVDIHVKLDHDIEHILPDYDLYDFPFSIGYTSRGCFRNCPWCLVPEKEGKIQDHAPISEFLDPRHNSIILIDNNFQASPRWHENLEYLRENNLRVSFNQGLDIRLITPEFAEALSQVKYYDYRFKKRRLYFSFDTLAIEQKIVQGLKILNDAGIPNHQLMFYILIGFNTTQEQDLHRIHKVAEWGALPYVMRFDKSKEQKHIDMARWVNRRYYKFLLFEEYDSKIRDPWKHRKGTRDKNTM